MTYVGTGTVRVTLSVPDGSSAQLRRQTPDGTWQEPGTSLTLTGTVSDINAALKGTSGSGLIQFIPRTLLGRQNGRRTEMRSDVDQGKLRPELLHTTESRSQRLRSDLAGAQVRFQSFLGGREVYRADRPAICARAVGLHIGDAVLELLSPTGEGVLQDHMRRYSQGIYSTV